MGDVYWSGADGVMNPIEDLFMERDKDLLDVQFITIKAGKSMELPSESKDGGAIVWLDLHDEYLDGYTFKAEK